MANASLRTIQEKVRILTGSLTQATMSDAVLNQYINTYLLYDFPETLALFNLRTTYSFYTSPFVDVYSTTNISSPLYDFTNKYIITDKPVYIAGFQSQYYESREQFFGQFPLTNSIANIGQTGDGTTNYFFGLINTNQAYIPNNLTQQICLLKNNVMFSSVDSNGNGLAMQDTPILDATTGLPTIYGSLYNPLQYNDLPFDPITNLNGYPVITLSAPYTDQSAFPTTNFINYRTGEYYVSFIAAPAAGVTINSQTIQQSIARPISILFFDGEFTVRPVPDQPYKIEMEVFTQPTELLSKNQNLKLNEWWQVVAYNAAKKIFEDRLDYESLALIMPSLKEQEILVGRRTIKQQTSQRSSTIYTQSLNGNGNGNNNGNGWNNY